ncbi:MAG: translation elongation factor Ts [Firmicutes bacterium]|nr:translation elongation factor Ts [Bacillota bacterium]
MNDIMKLKNATGAGMMDCKNALAETNGNYEKAVALLRERGIAKAAKKEGSDRINSEGAVFSYNHMGGKIAVLVEINCETDFAAKAEAFLELGKNIAMHIAAAKPLYLDETLVPTGELEAEKEILKKQALNEGKPAAVVEKMVEGRVKKYYEEICLVHQPFVKDPSKTIKQIVTETIAVIGEKISIRRFARFEMGEGLEKKEDNFAEEVAKQMGTKKEEAKPAAKKPAAKKK